MIEHIPAGLEFDTYEQIAWIIGSRSAIFLWAYKLEHLYQFGIHHTPWKLQEAKASINKQTMTPFYLTLFLPPLLKFLTLDPNAPSFGYRQK